METLDYQKQATDFLEKHGIEFIAEFVENAKHFEDDKETRDIYNVSFKRNGRKFSVRFGQSINNSGIKIISGNGKVLRSVMVDRAEITNKTTGKFDIHKARLWFNHKYFTLSSSESIVFPKAPTAYDVLACLTKYPVGEFEDFCSEYGYDTDSRKAKKTYKAVLKEWIGVNNFFTGSEIEEMQEIQ